MNVIFGILNIIILISILGSPYFVSKKVEKVLSKNRIFTSIVISIFIVVFLSFVFAWWTDYSNILLMKYYGYDFGIMGNEIDRLKNVDPKNIETVKQLKISIMGIGWPLKAIFGLVLLIPFSILTPTVYFLVKRKRSS